MVGETVYRRLIGNPAVGSEPGRLVRNRAVPHVSVVRVVGTVLIWRAENVELPGESCLSMKFKAVNPIHVPEEVLIGGYPRESCRREEGEAMALLVAG